VASSDYHVQLRFRKRVLSGSYITGQLPTVLKGLAPDVQAWYFADDSTREDVIAFRFATTPPRSLNPTALTKITLSGVSAESMGGARTTRAEVCFKNLNYQGSNEELAGQVIRQLQVVNHQGQKDIALAAGILGYGTVPNDNGASTPS